MPAYTRNFRLSAVITSTSIISPFLTRRRRGPPHEVSAISMLGLARGPGPESGTSVLRPLPVRRDRRLRRTTRASHRTIRKYWSKRLSANTPTFYQMTAALWKAFIQVMSEKNFELSVSDALIINCDSRQITKETLPTCRKSIVAILGSLKEMLYTCTVLASAHTWTNASICSDGVKWEAQSVMFCRNDFVRAPRILDTGHD